MKKNTKMNRNKQRTTFKKVSSILLVLLILCTLQASAIPQVPKRMVAIPWGDISTLQILNQKIADIKSTGADAVTIAEDIMYPEVITVVHNAGLELILGASPTAEHDPYKEYNMNDPAVRTQRINYLKDLLTKYPGIDGIEFEEPQSFDYSKASMNAFFSDASNLIHASGKIVAMNSGSVTEPNTGNSGIDRKYLDDNRIFDYYAPQTSEFSLEDNIYGYDDNKRAMPNTVIMPHAFIWSAATLKTAGCGNSWNKPDCYGQGLFDIVKYYSERGIPVKIWPSDDINLPRYNWPNLAVSFVGNDVKSIIGNIPTQAPTSTPTQAPTSTPTQAPTSTPTPTQAPTSTPTQTSTPTPTPTSTPTPALAPTPVIPTTNLISNPGFESGTSPWLFYTSGTGIYAVDSPGYEGIKAATIALSSSGSNVQLYQKDVALEPNTRYRLSFAAYSNAGDDMIVTLFKHNSPYTNYGLDFRVNLNTGWQTFTTEFTTNGFTGTVNDGRLMFWFAPFAGNGDKYYIDSVRLEKV